MRATLVLLLAGSGRRFGAAKQFLEIGGLAVWRRAMQVFAASEIFDEFVLVVPSGHEDRLAAEARADLRPATVLRVVAGGAERYLSVQCGLQAMHQRNRSVFIHDAARPMLHAEDLASLCREAEALHAGGDLGLVPGEAVTDTIKVVDADQRVATSLDRSTLRAVSTPQIFWADDLVRAYQPASLASSRVPTDDGEIWTDAGGHLRVVLLAHPNPKITLPSDLERWRL